MRAFLQKTTSSRFWIRLRRHAGGHYEALLSGLTCQDVYDCLKEEFEGRHLVFYSRLDRLEGGRVFYAHRVEVAVLGEDRRKPIFVVSPASVGALLHAFEMNQNDAWWFFPSFSTPGPEDVRRLELKPDLRYFQPPRETIDLFVASVRDLVLFTKNPEHVRKLMQRLFAKYAEGLHLLSPEEAAKTDFLPLAEAETQAMQRVDQTAEAHFRFIANEAFMIVKDTARDWRRAVYAYLPEEGRFERIQAKRLRGLTLLAENWESIIVWLSTAILIGGTVIILISVAVTLLFFLLTFFL